MSLVRGSGDIRECHFLAADRNVRIIGWGYTELYRAVHRVLSAIRNNGVSAFQGEVYTGRLGPIVGTLESVRIFEVSTFQGCLQGGVPLYHIFLFQGFRNGQQKKHRNKQQ